MNLDVNNIKVSLFFCVNHHGRQVSYFTEFKISRDKDSR